jgi:hypothetical protein
MLLIGPCGEAVVDYGWELSTGCSVYASPMEVANMLDTKYDEF